MTNETQPNRVSLTDKAWREQKTAGQTVVKTIRSVEFVGGVETEVPVDVEIRILGGTEQALMQDLILKRDEAGEFLKGPDGNFLPNDDEDGSLGETAIIAVSTGLSSQEVDEIRCNKSRGFWTNLLVVCNRYNGYDAGRIEEEKNGDELAR